MKSPCSNKASSINSFLSWSRSKPSLERPCVHRPHFRKLNILAGESRYVCCLHHPHSLPFPWLPCLNTESLKFPLGTLIWPTFRYAGLGLITPGIFGVSAGTLIHYLPSSRRSTNWVHDPTHHSITSNALTLWTTLFDTIILKGTPQFNGRNN